MPDFDAAIWSTGQRAGGFGFTLCQTLLNSRGGTSDEERIGEWLRQGGYRQAVFFGSTPTYAIIDLHTDEQALLGFGRSPATIANWNVGLVTIDSSGNFNPQSVFGGGTILLSDFSRTTTVASTTLIFDNDAIGVLLIAGGLTPYTGGSYTDQQLFWSYTRVAGLYNNVENCGGATDSSSTGRGPLGETSGTNIVTIASGSSWPCTRVSHVFCIASR